jgi:hypothetical protein
MLWVYSQWTSLLFVANFIASFVEPEGPPDKAHDKDWEKDSGLFIAGFIKHEKRV